MSFLKSRNLANFFPYAHIVRSGCRSIRCLMHVNITILLSLENATQRTTESNMLLLLSMFSTYMLQYKNVFILHSWIKVAHYFRMEKTRLTFSSFESHHFLEIIFFSFFTDKATGSKHTLRNRIYSFCAFCDPFPLILKCRKLS